MKKGWMALGLLCISLGLFACAGQGGEPVENPTQNGQETSEASQGSAEISPSGVETSQSGTENSAAQPGKDAVGERSTYLFTTGTDDILWLDAEGNPVDTIHWKESLNHMPEEWIETLSECTPLCYNGDVVLLSYYSYNTETGMYDTCVCALQPETGEVTSWFAEPEWYLDGVDCYEGKTYLLMHKYVGDEGSVLREVVFVKTEDGTYLQQESEMNTLLAEKGGNTYQLFSASDNSHVCQSYTRQMAENGFLVCYTGDNYCIESADGSTKVLSAIEEYVTFCGVLGEDLFFTHFEGMYGASLWRINAKTGKMAAITDSVDYFLTCSPEGVYYAVNYSDLNRVEENHVFVYLPDSDEVREVYQVDNSLGNLYEIPGITGFRLMGEKILCLDTDGSGFYWEMITPTIRGTDKKKIGNYVLTESYSQFGTLEVRPMTWVCPECGQVVATYYSQVFTVDRSAKGSYMLTKEREDKINEYLLQAEETNFADFVESDVSYLLEECSYHTEEYFIPSAHEWEVEEVERLGSGLLAVSYSGYWYGGGVHGYPYRAQYLFDLTTGETITFQDLYHGGEDEFRKIIAEGTKQDFLAKDDYDSPYFAEDAQTVYREAYDSVSMYDSSFTFSQNGITYYYAPYVMGPYASGYIEIQFSYEDFGITLP